VETLLAFGPAAARQAAQMGAHRQALTHYELVIRHIGALPEAEQARLRTEYSWQLYAAQRWDEAIEVAHRAVTLWEQVGDQVALGEALVVLSRSCFMASRPVEAAESVERAFSVLAPTGHPSLAYAQCYLGAILALTDRQEEALERLAEALRLAERGGRPDLVALALNYVGCARVDLGDLAGLDDLRSSLAMALALPHHEYAARAYTNLGEVTFQLRRYDELERCIADGTSFAGDHDLPGHAYNLEAHRAMLLMARGQWDAAETRLRRLVSAVPDPGELARLTLPALGRLLARRGDAGAAAILDRAWSLAQRNDTLAALAPAGLARLEGAWLSGEVDRAGDAIEILLARTATRAGARRRGELLRYLGRAGLTTEPFPECPPEWATGVSGDWRAAAEGWERIGDPYERALDLADSGAILPTMQALDILDRLGAVASARLVRTRLRELGVARVPRGRQRATRKNPGGLTDRQVDVLVLVAEGLTNTEIASRLILSTRTVDHHVSAILTGLGATSRREAARRARDLGLAPEHSTASV
jgi:ATP/maltotriose-dependent transcriptional regulator MalT